MRRGVGRAGAGRGQRSGAKRGVELSRETRLILQQDVFRAFEAHELFQDIITKKKMTSCGDAGEMAGNTYAYMY